MSKVIKPNSTDQTPEGMGIFLAGSIEMGVAEDWQSKVEDLLKEYRVTIYNPRRDEWDSSWEQKETNQEFRNQVNWEMNKIDSSHIVFMNFVGDTKSPISLLELGHIASHDPRKMIVSCPKHFWRRGNVEIVCSRSGIPLFENFKEAASSLISRVEMLTNI